MDQDIEIFVRGCERGNKKKVINEDKAPVPMQITTPIQRPFQKVAMDIVVPLPKTHRGNQSLLTFQDHFTKNPEPFAIADQKAKTTAKILVEAYAGMELHKNYSLTKDQISSAK